MDSERIFTAIDVSNLFKSCREQYGKNARVNFQILSQMVPATRHPCQIQQRLTAYIVTTPDQNHHIFAQVLRSFGYQIRERFMRYDKAIHKPTHTDWDVGITIDAIDLIDTYDTFALVSGDGDFGLLLDYLKTKGKRTLVISFEKNTSKFLYKSADELLPLKENILFMQANNAL